MLKIFHELRCIEAATSVSIVLDDNFVKNAFVCTWETSIWYERYKVQREVYHLAAVPMADNKSNKSEFADENKLRK